MSAIKNILVAVEFSTYSKDLIKYAADLATQTQASLVVVSIINSRDVQAVRQVAALGYDVDGEHYIQGIRDERKKMLDKVLLEIRFPKDRLKALIPVGNPVDQLLKTIVQEKVDTVVMGVKGRTDLEHVFIGSVAEKLFRRSPVTVVSYRNDKHARKLKKRIQLS